MSILSSTNSGINRPLTMQVLCDRNYYVDCFEGSNYIMFKKKFGYIELEILMSEHGRFFNYRFDKAIELNTVRQLIIIENFYKNIQQGKKIVFSDAFDAVKKEFGVIYAI